MSSIIRVIFSTLLFCLVTTNFAVADINQCLQAPLSLQVLGSGGPEFYRDRASTSYLLRIKGKALLLIDAGSGSKFRFGQSGANFNDVRIMLFSHFHVDHSADFPAYIKSAFFSDRNQDLLVFGPVGNQLLASTGEFIHAMIGDKQSAYPYLSRYLDGSDDYRIHINELNVKNHAIQTFEPIKGIKLSAVPVHHGPLPALAWRVDIDNKSVVFSGDMNGEYNTLAELATNADILLAHNAIPESAGGVARNLHMPPSVIAAIAAHAQVKHLVLSHRMQRTLGKKKEKQTLSIIRKKYHGPIAFANDLDCFVP